MEQAGIISTYEEYIQDAKDKVKEGLLYEGLEQLEKAYELKPSERLANKIGKLKDFIKENIENEEEDNCMIDIGQGFSLHENIVHRLYKHQLEGVLWFWKLYNEEKGGILGDDMGLGKTIQVIAFLSGMFDAELVKTVLIIMPVSLISNWQKEFEKWAPGLRVREFHGASKKERNKNLQRIQNKSGVVLTTYGMIVSNSELLGTYEGERFTWDYIILDEGHKIKNPSQKTSKCVRTIPSRFHYILSGTPIQNNLGELWALVDFITCGKLLGSSRTFKAMFENPIVRARQKDASAYEKKMGNTLSESLRKLIKPYFLHRSKDDVTLVNFEPEDKKASDVGHAWAHKDDIILWTYLSEVQIQLYQAFLESDKVKQVMESRHLQRSPLVLLNILKLLVNHPRLLKRETQEQLGLLSQETSPDSLKDESGKLDVLLYLLDRLKADGHRTLVFSQYRKMLDIIEKVISQKHTYLRMDGTITSHQDRQKLIDEFTRNPQYSIFLFTTKVGGEGINLVAADRVIIYDPSWNPGNDDQAVNRAHRIGQDKDVIIYRFITCGTVEEKIYRKAVFKTAIMKQATGRSKNPYRYFTKQELRELFALENPRFSTTQQQLNELHPNHGRIQDHVEYLNSLEIFGISYHSGLFSKEDNKVEDEAFDVKIKEQVKYAEEAVSYESSLAQGMSQISLDQTRSESRKKKFSDVEPSINSDTRMENLRSFSTGNECLDDTSQNRFVTVIENPLSERLSERRSADSSNVDNEVHSEDSITCYESAVESPVKEERDSRTGTVGAIGSSKSVRHSDEYVMDQGVLVSLHSLSIGGDDSLSEHGESLPDLVSNSEENNVISEPSLPPSSSPSHPVCLSNNDTICSSSETSPVERDRLTSKEDEQNTIDLVEKTGMHEALSPNESLYVEVADAACSPVFSESSLDCDNAKKTENDHVGIPANDDVMESCGLKEECSSSFTEGCLLNAEEKVLNLSHSASLIQSYTEFTKVRMPSNTSMMKNSPTVDSDSSKSGCLFASFADDAPTVSGSCLAETTEASYIEVVDTGCDPMSFVCHSILKPDTTGANIALKSHESMVTDASVKAEQKPPLVTEMDNNGLCNHLKGFLSSQEVEDTSCAPESLDFLPVFKEDEHVNDIEVKRMDKSYVSPKPEVPISGTFSFDQVEGLAPRAIEIFAEQSPKHPRGTPLVPAASDIQSLQAEEAICNKEIDSYSDAAAKRPSLAASVIKLHNPPVNTSESSTNPQHYTIGLANHEARLSNGSTRSSITTLKASSFKKCDDLTTKTPYQTCSLDWRTPNRLVNYDSSSSSDDESAEDSEVFINRSRFQLSFNASIQASSPCLANKRNSSLKIDSLCDFRNRLVSSTMIADGSDPLITDPSPLSTDSQLLSPWRMVHDDTSSSHTKELQNADTLIINSGDPIDFGTIKDSSGDAENSCQARTTLIIDGDQELPTSLEKVIKKKAKRRSVCLQRIAASSSDDSSASDDEQSDSANKERPESLSNNLEKSESDNSDEETATAENKSETTANTGSNQDQKYGTAEATDSRSVFHSVSQSDQHQDSDSSDEYEMFLRKSKSNYGIIESSEDEEGNDNQTEEKEDEISESGDSLKDFIVDDSESDEEGEGEEHGGDQSEQDEENSEEENIRELSFSMTSIEAKGCTKLTKGPKMSKTPLTESNTRFFTTPRPFHGKLSTSGKENSYSRTPYTPVTGLKKKALLDGVITPQTPGGPETPAYRRVFRKIRDQIVAEVFATLNRTVFDEQIPSDLEIKWNKRLTKTAGLCHYSRQGEKRNAWIELSDKVCDCNERIRDTLAHELCHAASWLINNIKDGHGKVWRHWARKVTHQHPEIPTITTCHNYELRTKFTYKCENIRCNYSIGRHSKSVNLEKERCPVCMSQFRLLYSDGTPAASGKLNPFGSHVKNHYATVKKRNPGASHKDIMKELAQEFSNMQTGKQDT